MNLSNFSLPGGRAVLSRLPQLPPALAFTTLLNIGEKVLLRHADLAALRGKRFQIEVQNIGLKINFERNRLGFFPCRKPCPPDLRIAASAQDFWKLLQREEDPDTLFFNRRLLIEGDTDLGLTVKNLLDAIEIPDVRLFARQR